MSLNPPLIDRDFATVSRSGRREENGDRRDVPQISEPSGAKSNKEWASPPETKQRFRDGFLTLFHLERKMSNCEVRLYFRGTLLRPIG
jgi:hypothetical protein